MSLSGGSYTGCHGMFQRFLLFFFLGRVGDTVFAYFVMPTPPLSVGVGLGNPATHLRQRTHFRSFGLGLGGVWRAPC